MSRIEPTATTEASIRAIRLGPFSVSDADRSTLVPHLAELAARTEQLSVVYSLHVGGLNLRNDVAFTTALSRGDVLLPDGISVALLARIAGAKGMHRHPTTDLGWDILEILNSQLGRPVKVALIGGPDGLASHAAERIAHSAKTETVFTEHGFHTEWKPVLHSLAHASPDLLLVGMGMPHEALWVDANRDLLPPCLVLTCGGWFGHITGAEKRAPQWVRKLGLEWLARLAQSPRRLWRRYATGMWSILAMVPTAFKNRQENR